MKNQTVKYLLFALAIFCGIVLWINPAIPQNNAYHHFCDGRLFFGVPNFLNTLSNLPFLIIGIIGLRSIKKVDYRISVCHAVLYVGVILTCLGSSYYHLTPNNSTLVWDRLPMTLIFSSFYALLLMKLVSNNFGWIIFLVMIPFGILSIFYWYYTEINGVGDLRPYIFVQFFPLITTPILLVFSKNNLKGGKYLWLIFLFYLFAKLTEHFDAEIYELLTIVSGHTLKHLLAAGSVYYIYKLAQSHSVDEGR